MLVGNFDNGLWFDEVFSLQVTDPANSLGKAHAIQSIDASPFTYYFILRFWRIVFGPDFYTAQFFNIAMFLVATILAWIVWPKNKSQEYLIFLSLNITCVAIIYYLLEIRTYSLICAISLFVASCFNRLLDQTESSGGAGRSKYLYIAIIVSAAIVINLHAWGALFGAGIFIALFIYDRAFANRTFGLPAFVISGVLISAFFFVSFLPIFNVFSSRLTAASIGFGAKIVDDPLTMLTGIWQLLYVTDRSALFGAAVLLTIAYHCAVRFSLIRSSLLVYIAPIVFVYAAVIIAHLIFERFIYKSYFNVIFFPFLFMFFTKIAYSAATGVVRFSLIAALILANVGSIPFFVKFAEQPFRLEIQDGISVYMPAPKQR
ncbi:MAG: hypothetical protein HQ503_04935 [Rhodospirillales bacterium]|nr:hypothetical protein [Rhodospirillales bacterium]